MMRTALLKQPTPAALAWIVVVSLMVGVAGCGPGASESRSGDADGSPAPAVQIELVEATDGARPAFQVLGLSSDELAAIRTLSIPARDEWLKVYVADLEDPPPMMGEVDVIDKALRFTPRHPLEPGVRYRVEFRRGGASEGAVEPVRVEFEIPRPAVDDQSTSLLRIYPSSDELPENQLKFYLHFSGPMSRGQAYRHIRLLDDQEQPLDGAFLELDQELWDPGHTRFTLLLDPGRVKRGLVPREELGPVLEAGKSYTLVVSRDWSDAHGESLESEVRKTFRVSEPQEAAIDVTEWKIEPPMAGTIRPLAVRFPRPLDHSLLERMLWVVELGGGSRVGGSVATDEHETVWRFTPQTPWTRGEYQLIVQTTLEDLAGNSIGRAFEVQPSGDDQRTITDETVAVPFAIVELATASSD